MTQVVSWIPATQVGDLIEDLALICSWFRATVDIWGVSQWVDPLPNSPPTPRLSVYVHVLLTYSFSHLLLSIMTTITMTTPFFLHFFLPSFLPF